MSEKEIEKFSDILNELSIKEIRKTALILNPTYEGYDIYKVSKETAEIALRIESFKKDNNLY